MHVNKALEAWKLTSFRWLVSLSVIAVLAFIAPAGSASQQRQTSHVPAGKIQVTVGSKEFTEELIVGQMASLLLENAGYKVVRKLGLAGTTVVHSALVRGDIDAYVEYTGTGLTTILKLPTQTNPKKVYDTVRTAYAKQFQLTWLKPWGFNDTYAMIMRKDRANKLHIKTLSDMASASGSLTLGATQEFISRPDGLPGLSKKYNLNFKDSRGMAAGLMYQALSSGQIDVASGFSTDGQISALHLVVIKDNKRFFPPYYAAPVVRQATLAKDPKIAGILNKLAGKISNKTMAKLNLEVEQGKKDPQVVARAFLKQMRLIKG